MVLWFWTYSRPCQEYYRDEGSCNIIWKSLRRDVTLVYYYLNTITVSSCSIHFESFAKSKIHAYWVVGVTVAHVSSPPGWLVTPRLLTGRCQLTCFRNSSKHRLREIFKLFIRSHQVRMRSNVDIASSIMTRKSWCSRLQAASYLLLLNLAPDFLGLPVIFLNFMVYSSWSCSS